MRALAAAERGSLQFTPQPQTGSLTPKNFHPETRLDWTKPWKEVHDRIRGLSPYPGAWFEIDGLRVKPCARVRARARVRLAQSWTTT